VRFRKPVDFERLVGILHYDWSVDFGRTVMLYFWYICMTAGHTRLVG